MFRLSLRGLFYGSKKWRWSIRWIIDKSSRSMKGTQFPNFEVLAGRENCIFFEKHHPEFLLQEKSQSRGTESWERGSALSRKTDRLHDLRLSSSHWCSWQFLIMLIYSQSLFATTTFRNLIRDGMKFYYLWPRSHLMTLWKVCANREYESLINSKHY